MFNPKINPKINPTAALLRRTLPACLAASFALAPLVLAPPPVSAANPPAITYTGQLLSGVNPVPNGSYDFQFSLYTAVSGGSQVGATVSVPSIVVAGGVFYAELNFGNALNGQPLYLQTAYRLTGGGAYTTQAPRKLLPQSAYADFATLSGSTKALQGHGISQTGPAAGQVLEWTGTLWTPTTFTNPPGSITASMLALPLAVSGAGSLPLLSVTSAGVGAAISGVGTGNIGDGVYGESAGNEASGVYGYAHNGFGVSGFADNDLGVGVSGQSVGVRSKGVYGGSAKGTGGYFITNSGVDGVYGESDGLDGNGVYGRADNGSGAYGVYGASASGYAGYFSGKVNVTGDLNVTGTITAGTKDFKIDHPLDPENKYLSHACVESDKMEDIYNGHVLLDAGGAASVHLPAWFQALNTEFEYHLTPIGAPAPNLYIAQEIAGNTFQVAGGQPGLKVSWQVTGVRHDAYAAAHPLQVEEDKPAAEQGLYLHPKEWGQSETLGIGSQAQKAHLRRIPNP